MMNNYIEHVELPSTGIIVNENSELAQLSDSCFYVLPSNKDLSLDIIRKHLDKLITSKKQFINRYEFEILEELPCMDCHTKLDSAIKNGHYNLLMSIYEPGSACGKKYVLAKTDINHLETDLASMLIISEKLTAQSIRELMLSHAICAPSSFIKRSKHIWDSDNFWKNFLVRQISDKIEGKGNYSITLGSKRIKEILGPGEILSHRKRMEMQENFVNNLRTLKVNNNNQKALAEVQIVLESININNDEVISYLTSMPDSYIEQFTNKVTPKRIAENSKMVMEIRWIGYTDKRKTSDGRFRLYLHKNGEEQMVHFKRHSSFILYLIYLIDVYKSENVDTLNIQKEYKEVFCTLFEKVYAYGGLENFKTMFGKGNSEQELLRHCLSDIRFAIGNACEKLHESATPYILKDINSHLFILRQNVKIDTRLIASL